MRLSSAILKRHAPSLLVGIGTLAVSLASVALVSLSVSRVTKSSLSFERVELPLQPTIQVQEPQSGLGKAPKRRPKVVQSAIVHFPHHGEVKVESIEQVGKFPKIVFTNVKTGAALYRSAITDPDGWLKLTDDEVSQPFLRFREVRSPGFPTPLIMAVAVYPGGSDDGSYLAVFGEANGRFARLTDKLVDTAVQGGFYLGFLNRKFGYGLVSWCFDWNFDASEGHYDYHHYSMQVYTLHDGKFRRVLSATSKRRYDTNHSSRPLLELGIRAKDMRKTITKVKEYADAEG